MHRLLGEERETYLLGLLRLALATLLLLLTLKLAQPLLRGEYFGDVFHMPLVPEGWVPSRAVHGLLLALQGLLALSALLGVAARPALFLASAIGLYGLTCDRLGYHNNRYELLLLTLLLAFTPCDRSFKPFRRAEAGPAPYWAVRLVGAQLSLVYLASSLGKLLDPDWRSGLVLSPRFALAIPVVERFMPSGLASSLFASREFAHVASMSAIASELFLALGLWFAPTRVLALWIGFMFHAGIELFAHVELFSYTMIAGYLAFVTPELRERTLSWNASREGKRLASACRKLDVLARFQHHVAPEQASLICVTDRAGARHQGLAAWRELARAFPPLFPLWLPLRLATLRPRRAKAPQRN